ncbi:MAG: leucyl aminopeptidase [Candidatus Thermoplasmatota archaeon]|nr:leucyl aminopeptidase [Candidatus Thermoplasmatota archaeon]MEE3083239.1 leucyl aminopeptidase [Candidatus Thermoplasmatota archaeon]
MAKGDDKSKPSVDEDELDQSTQEALERAADTVCKECMQIQRSENVLIVTDPHTAVIGRALYESATKISDRVLLVMMPTTHRHGDEPPGPVSDLMRKQDVVLAPTRYSLTHTRARMQACREGTRIATMPGITLQMFTEGGMTTDFNTMQSAIAQLGKTLKRQRNVTVTTSSGTDVTFEISGRWELGDNGICNRPGQVTNLPAGKILAMPKEGTMEGKIVIDGTWDASLVDTPLELIVEGGIVTKVIGEASDDVKALFVEASRKLKPQHQSSVWTVAEFGFGMNPRARLIGNVLEDEKMQGTCYFAIGDNTNLGGNAHCGIHVTGVLREPTVTIGDTKLLDDGDIRI